MDAERPGRGPGGAKRQKRPNGHLRVVKAGDGLPGPADIGIGDVSEHHLKVNVARAAKTLGTRQDLLAWSTVAYLIRTEINYSGSWIRGSDGSVWLYCGRGIGHPRPELLTIDHRDDRWLTLLAQRYGLIGGERVAQLITQAVKTHVFAKGVYREVYRFSAFKNGVLYLSRYDGTCYKLDGKEITIIPNGQDVIFADDDEGVTVEADIWEGEEPPEEILDRLVNDLQYVDVTAGGQAPELQRKLLAIWLLSLGFPDLLVGGKPLLLLSGAKGAGKGATIQRIQNLIYGSNLAQQIGEGNRDADDFGVMLLGKPLALLDEIQVPIPWLHTALCAYATGGSWRRRTLHTTNKVTEIKPRAFVAIATNNPSMFKKDDLADRSLVIRLDRRENKGGYTPLSVLLENVLEDRPRLFGQWLWYLNKVVLELKRTVEKDLESASSYRLSDFARLAFAAGRSLGYDREEVTAVLEAAQDERNALMVEGDALVEVLDRWLDIPSNVGKWIALVELYNQLLDIAMGLRIPFFKSPKGLKRRLVEVDQAMAKRFAISHKGEATYSFRRA